MESKIIYREALLSDMEWINARYREIEFVPSDFQKEKILIAEKDGERAGIGRLVTIDSKSVELGGIYVLHAFRKRGIAREIVSRLLKTVPKEKTLYCIPFMHLLSFYESFGFVEVKKMALLPNPILSKFSWCKENYSLDTALLVLPK